MAIHSKKGIALILVLSSLAMLSAMMVEFTFRSRMNIKISSNFKNAIKARELAQSGIHFAMLELKVYKTLKEHPMIQKIPGFKESMIDMIWQFGFLYPPLPSKQASFGLEKEAAELIEKSKIDGKIHVKISDESAKININDLENTQFREGILQQLESLLEQKKMADEAFFDKYRNLRMEELAHNIIDWIDKDTDGIDGGGEDDYYSRLPIPYKTKNAPLDTVSELALIEGFDNEDIFNLLLPHVTVYPTGGLNVNRADAAQLLSISPELTPEDAESIIQRRTAEGYFKNGAEFEEYCRKTLLKSAEFNQRPKVPLTTSTNIFSLVSTAEVKGAAQKIRAVIDISQTMPDESLKILYWNVN